MDEKPIITTISESTQSRIVAGQAVTDLCSAVKELIDNSLDAKAKSINVRLYNQGIDAIEIIDDGTGIPPSSRPFLATRHATSKLASFSDLYTTTQTLGFRGEALFSLSNLSQSLIVTTRTKSDRIGQRLTYGKDGSLDDEATREVPRKVGTTVTVNKLFDVLPVRRADFVKRIKSQRAKMMKLVQGYAVLSLGVKFNLTDISKKKTEVKLATSASSRTLRDTVSAVLGSQFLSGLCDFKVELTSLIKDKNRGKEWTEEEWYIEGLVSKPPGDTNGKGVARDLQFFSINGRPVDLPKLSRLLMEAWRNFDGPIGGGKKPACVLLLRLPNDTFDVNLSPDKREVMLNEEAEICAVIRNKLMELWEGKSYGSFQRNEVETMSQNKNDVSLKSTSEGIRLSQQRQTSISFPSFAFSRATTQARAPKIETNDFERNTYAGPPRKRGEMENDKARQDWNRARSVFNANENSPQLDDIRHLENATKERNYDSDDDFVNTSKSFRKRDEDRSSPPSQKRARRSLQRDAGFTNALNKIDLMSKFAMNSHLSKRSSYDNVTSENKRTDNMSRENYRSFRGNDTTKTSHDIKASKNYNSFLQDVGNAECNKNPIVPDKNDAAKKSPTMEVSTSEHKPPQSTEKKLRNPAVSSNTSLSPPRSGSTPLPLITPITSEPSPSPSSTEKNQVPSYSSVVWDEFSTEAVIQQSRSARSQMKSLRHTLTESKKLRCKQKSSTPTNDDDNPLGSSVGITNSSSSSPSKINLTKNSFLKMSVIGQFNLGFILTKCENNHLWIMDQHACDEIYNFENLVRNTTLQNQNLIRPLPLEALSPAEQNIVLERMDVFQKNGFRFSYDEMLPPRERLFLTAVPYSGSAHGKKGVDFGKDDVRDLCALLGAELGVEGRIGNNAVRRYAGGDGGGRKGGEIKRLPKAIAMFASRACRSSIMIGTSLSMKEMNGVVKKMHNVDQPWNCPHGRPTMRHVTDLIKTFRDDELALAEHYAKPSLAVMSQTEDSDEMSIDFHQSPSTEIEDG